MKIFISWPCDPGAKLTGRNGADLYISVPVGTIVSERVPEEGVNYDDEEDDDESDDAEEGNDEDTKDLDLNQVRILKTYLLPSLICNFSPSDLRL